MRMATRIISNLHDRTDESAKSSAYLYETLVDPKWANSGDANHCAISKAFNAELSLWDLLELRGNEGRLKRFGVAMEGSSRVDPIENLLESALCSSYCPIVTYADTRS